MNNDFSGIEHAISLPFSIDGYGNISKTSNQSEIWEARVKSAIGTAIGERVMRAGYGTRIPEMFFDTQDALDAGIRKEVSSVFDVYLPLLTLNSVDVIYDDLYGEMTATISYSLPNQTVTTTSVSIVTINKTTPPYEEKR
jgi:phage baseplate assembly protein W